MPRNIRSIESFPPNSLRPRRQTPARQSKDDEPRENPASRA
jgi:hypothetical protein